MHTPSSFRFIDSLSQRAVFLLILLCMGELMGGVPHIAADGQTEHQAKPTFQDPQKGYTYTFPHDHGAHENFLTEWWYFTGHVFTANNRRFGYELTFFRRAIDDERAWANPSQWAIRQLYFAHFALTDEQNEDFRFAEKVSREAFGKAGATQGTLHTWIDQWSVNAVDDSHQQFRLQAEADKFSIELVTNSSKSPVIHGRDGISRKGTLAKHASHYYSLTRLHTTGKLQIDGEEFTVTGTSWMDHEFASSELEDGLVGWDWFSLQLDSGHDIMTYWLRQEDGTFSPASSGTLIFPDGTSQHLTRKDLTITILDHWKSPKSGARYPSQWTLSIPSHQIQLHITPRMNDQELRTDRSTQVTYWEGAVDTSGTFGQKPTTGMGYVELTGYDQTD